MMKRSLLSIAAMSLVALAGCADDSGSSEDDEFSDELDDELQATDDTGVIRGVVVDPSIVPIADADVKIVGGDERTKTNDEGAFGFAGLAPGSYFLEVSRIGYNTTQSSVTVEAGVDKPPVAKIQLQPDASSVPYHQSFRFDGYIECSATTAAPGVVGLGGNYCSIIESETGIELDEPLIVHELAGEPDFLQSEMVWDNTQPLGGELSLLYSWPDPACEPFLCDLEAAGKSPVVLQANETQIMEIGFGTEHDLMVRVFNEALDETEGAVGVTFEQQFTVFTTAFYGYMPPDGYMFIEDGEPIDPEA